MQSAGTSLNVLLDIDAGQHRTGVPVGPDAKNLYRHIHEAAGLTAAGLHVYDGHQHQKSREERSQAVRAEWDRLLDFRETLRDSNLPVPAIVAGGTATFPIYAELGEPTLEVSPGTCVFHDANYAEKFPDLDFTPAALLLTRVISRPAADRVTVDLGYKAVAADPPQGRRVVFPDVPDAEEVLHSEEHLVLKTARAALFRPGDELLAIPRHICPTSALHKQAHVVSAGRVIDRWDVAARDRWLSI
jgi:D-serine deaminase-like pyridoxal phosphate-dependent protein